ncbi:MAG: hypothetical protein K2H18_01430, partial [Muribaculaceae bacterium]|nr:hypothetical protein [Muribaculaceae bacterium]
GKGVLQDYRVAAENYWRAAERDNAEGAYRYAVMLRDGIGVAQDKPRALKYFKKAAEKDYPEAAYQAGLLENQGVKMPVKNVSRGKAGTAAKKQMVNKGATTNKKKK